MPHRSDRHSQRSIFYRPYLRQRNASSARCSSGVNHDNAIESPSVCLRYCLHSAALRRLNRVLISVLTEIGGTTAPGLGGPLGPGSTCAPSSRKATRGRFLMATASGPLGRTSAAVTATVGPVVAAVGGEVATTLGATAGTAVGGGVGAAVAATAGAAVAATVGGEAGREVATAPGGRASLFALDLVAGGERAVLLGPAVPLGPAVTPGPAVGRRPAVGDLLPPSPSLPLVEEV
jgi:hypothetical protein